ncbi:phosphatase PAP2 family protein [Thalassiella azotivora]
MAERRPAALHALRLAAVPAGAWLAVLLAVGWLVGGPGGDLVAAEDAVVRDLEAGRTPLWDDVTHVASWTANTGTVVLGGLLVGLLLRLALRDWLPALLLWAGVATQSALFLTTTLVVQRARPDVEQLDPAPPTSSFPSGHTGAATAFWLGLALVVVERVGRRWLRVVLLLGMLLPPLAVGAARVYRGMHHPSDVVVGVLNGTVAVLVVRYAVLAGHDGRRPRRAQVLPLSDATGGAAVSPPGPPAAAPPTRGRR